eukprot:9479101-Pyramimonas_sp.AAC.1
MAAERLLAFIILLRAVALARARPDATSAPKSVAAWAEVARMPFLRSARATLLAMLLVLATTTVLGLIVRPSSCMSWPME